MSLATRLQAWVLAVGLDVKSLNGRISTLENAPGGGGGIAGPPTTQVDHVALFADTTGTALKSGGALHAVAFSGIYSDLTQKPTLGTASEKDVPTSGNASGQQVVLGNDARLFNARSPTSHGHDAGDISGIQAIANGGTGGNTQATAQTGLNVPSRTGSGASGTWGISISGTAASATSASSASTATTATTLATARTFTISGAVTGTASSTFNGGANCNIAATAIDVGHTGVAGVLGLDHGGTNATTAAGARTQLGVPPTNAASMTGGLTLTSGDMSVTNGRFSSTSGMRCKRGLTGAFGNNNHYFYWTGSVYEIWVDTSNVGSFQGTSDERLKHDIKPAKRSSIFLENVVPIRYQYKTIGIFKKNNGRRLLGFSAQNLLKAIPEAVSGDPEAVFEDGTPMAMTIDTTPILAALVLEVKALYAQVQELQAQVQTFKAA